MIKTFFKRFSVVICAGLLSACSTNPATGEKQFTAFMSPAQENEIGASEHKKIVAEFGLYDDKKLASYVSDIGARVSQKTERPDVDYKFFIIDSPIINAFALPGGYIYVSRGLMALANSESELASVLAHETGHITARHSAERYSRGMVTNIGALILANAVGSAEVSQAIGLGSNLYLSSYSRGQETQADSLGVRYLSRSGYDPIAMSGFLSQMQAEKELNAVLDGEDPNAAGGVNYFSTHPATKERVVNAQAEARNYMQGGDVDQSRYLNMLNGLVYGDNISQGVLRNGTFYHPPIGFKFDVPKDAKLNNSASAVVVAFKSGSAVVFNMKANDQSLSPEAYIKNVWLKDHGTVNNVERITINGMPAAAYSLKGNHNNQDVMVQLIAIEWSANRIARFQVIYPEGTNTSMLDTLKRITYSFARLSAKEKAAIKPQRIKIIKASSGQSVASLANQMVFDDHKEKRFRVLNGMKANETLLPGALYKIVVE